VTSESVMLGHETKKKSVDLMRMISCQ